MPVSSRERAAGGQGGGRTRLGRAVADTGIGLTAEQQATLEFRAICRQHDDESIERLVYLRDHSDNEWVVMAPIQILFERGHGRPKQEITGPDDGPVQVE